MPFPWQQSGLHSPFSGDGIHIIFHSWFQWSQSASWLSVQTNTESTRSENMFRKVSYLTASCFNPGRWLQFCNDIVIRHSHFADDDRDLAAKSNLNIWLILVSNTCDYRVNEKYFKKGYSHPSRRYLTWCGSRSPSLRPRRSVRIARSRQPIRSEAQKECSSDWGISSTIACGGKKNTRLLGIEEGRERKRNTGSRRLAGADFDKQDNLSGSVSVDGSVLSV